MAKFIIILDFQEAKTYIRAVQKELKKEDTEDVINYYEQELGIHAQDCQYMTVNELIIDIKT